MIKQAYDDWLDKRIPESGSHTTGHKSIFIIPNLFGFSFLLGAILVVIFGINYQNTLVLGVGLFMICFLVVSIITTFRSLSGLNLNALHVHSVFLGDHIHFPFMLRSPIPYLVLEMGWHDQKKLGFSPKVDEMEWVTLTHDLEVQLSFASFKRGPIEHPRIKIRTRYPLGLCTAWTLPKLKFEGLVYPKPVFIPFQISQSNSEEADYDEGVTLSDDVKDYRPYRQGDNLKHVMWRQAAKGRALMVKEFDHFASEKMEFDFNQIQGVGVEDKLSILCGWILQADRNGIEYSLFLPGINFGPARDFAHREKCLSALALYGQEN